MENCSSGYPALVVSMSLSAPSDYEHSMGNSDRRVFLRVPPN